MVSCKKNTDKIILGIDPGTRILGFGVIHVLGSKAGYVDMGVINLKNIKDHFVTLKTIFEYAPRSIKLAVTGKGAASKEQVAMMAQRLLGVDIPQEYLDATDALAIAICHHYHIQNPVLQAGGGKSAGKKSSGSWEQFVQANPGRIK